MTTPTWRVHPVSPEKPPKAPYPCKVKIGTLTCFHKYSTALQCLTGPSIRAAAQYTMSEAHSCGYTKKGDMNVHVPSCHIIKYIQYLSNAPCTRICGIIMKYTRNHQAHHHFALWHLIQPPKHKDWHEYDLLSQALLAQSKRNYM